MKKLLALLMAVVMVLSLFAGCGDAEDIDRDKDDKRETSSKEGPTKGTEEDPGEGSTKDTGEAPSEEPDDPTEEAPGTEVKPVTPADTVMFQEDGITVKYMGLDEGILSCELEILLENDSDKDISLSVDTLVVNGICVDTWGYFDVAAGDQVSSTVDIYSETLDEAGIDRIATVDFVDSDIREKGSLDSLHQFSYTLVIDGEGFTQTIDTTGEVLVDEAGFRVISKGLKEGLMGKDLVLLIENDSTSNVTVLASDLAINGYMVDGWMRETVYRDTVRFCKLEMFEDSMQEQGIQKIEEITFTLELLQDGAVVQEFPDLMVVPEGDEVQTDPGETETPDEIMGATLAETVVFDQDDIRITLTGLTERWMGPAISVLLENDTERDIYFTVEGLLVNGVFVGCYDSVDAAAGKKANGTLTLDSDELALAGIDTLATISLVRPKIIDEDSYETLYEFSCDLVTSVGADYVQQIDQNGEVLVDQDGIKIISKGLVTDSTTVKLVLLMINESDAEIVVEADAVSVNGQAIDCWLYDPVIAGSVRYSELSVYNNTLEELGIYQVQQMTFQLEIMDRDVYETVLITDPITVTVD